MADKEYKNSSSFKELMIAIPGAIIGFTLLVSLLAVLFGMGKEEEAPAPAATAEAAPAPTPEEKNVAPVAVVDVAAEGGEHVEKSGADVVKGVCVMCHGAGLMNAPKIGDAGQWGPRLAQGYETLVKHAIEGIRSMPARGGNPDLTDGEIAAAVAEMANASGAKFDPASLKK